MKYHGNYCGPYWSAGIAQPSVDSDIPSLDDFDETCKIHDRSYALGEDLESADWLFASENITRPGIKPKLAALAVGAQAILRTVGLKKKKESKMPVFTDYQAPAGTNSNLGQIPAPSSGDKIIASITGNHIELPVPGYDGLFYDPRTRTNVWKPGYGPHMVNNVVTYGLLPGYTGVVGFDNFKPLGKTVYQEDVPMMRAVPYNPYVSRVDTSGTMVSRECTYNPTYRRRRRRKYVY